MAIRFDLSLEPHYGVAKRISPRIERLLAGYIGPIARHLVKAAVSRVSNPDELVAHLANELETETDRHEFTRRWRSGEARTR